MNRWTTWLVRGLVLAVLVLAGCAQQRAPINRVQPNALDKSFFVGPKLNDDSDNPEFYSRGFVIDGSAHQSDISVGLYTGTDRIKWQITKDYLIARKSYQIVIGQDTKTKDGKVDGTIVAKYKILSHFDIKRAYNPQTGEPLNIIEENTSDRPWQERQYMRVDWSTNQVNNPEWGEMFFGKVFGNMTVEPLTYNVQDPTNEDAPHFEPKNGYFDITNKYYIAPENTQFSWGTIPTCMLIGFYTGSTAYDCNPQEATVRFSFWKVDPNHDFQPTENTKRKLDIVANFGGAGGAAQPAFQGGTTQCWDPQYGYQDACFHQYLSKLNLWKLSHQRIGSCNVSKDCTDQGLPDGSQCMPDHTCSVACTSDADTNHDGTADQCAKGKTGYKGSAGAQCDTTMHQCTIPIRDRVLQPQGYWLNKETPAELLDQLDDSGKPTSKMLGANGQPAAADANYEEPEFRGAMEDVIKSWNQLITTSIAYGREAECRRTGAGSRADCHKKYFVENPDGTDKTQMIAFGGWGIATPKVQPQDTTGTALVACHAPVRDYDFQPVCGKVDMAKKCNPAATTNQCGPNMGCNPEGHCADVARNGDQRKNMIFYWPWDSAAQYGGVAGLGADPETGEEHGVTAMIMGRSATRAAGLYRDYLQTAMGDFSTGDIENGVPRFIYNKVLQNGYSPASAWAKKARGEKVAQQQPAAGAPAGAPASQAAQDLPTGNKPVATPGFSKHMLTMEKLRKLGPPRTPSTELQSTAQLKWDALANTLRGTPIEADLVNPHWAMDAIGASPNQPITADVLQQASPLRNLDPGAMKLWRDQIANKLAARGICFTNDITHIGSVNFQGLARWYEDKFKDMKLDTDVPAPLRDKDGLWLPPSAVLDANGQPKYPRDAKLVKERGDLIYRELFHGMATGIAIHEVGHTLGMRHNFESSYDAPNFMPQYWQLRTDEGNTNAMGACSTPRTAGSPDTCMGPRFNDPETLKEQGLAPPTNGRSNGHPDINYFGNSTVMEYEQDYMSPGIGPADFFYTEAVYGGVLETYDIDHVKEGGVSEQAQKKFVPNDALNAASFRLEAPGGNDVFVHYTQLARDMNVFKASYCRDATPDELKQAQWRIIDGKVCTRSPRDRYMWKDFINDNEEGQHPQSTLASTSVSANGTGWTFTDWRTSPSMPNNDGKDHERWPYRYGESYSPSYLQSNYTDNGADPYEVVTNNAAYYRVDYPHLYFRQQQRGYLPLNLPSYVSQRFFERERAYHWILSDFSGNMGDPDVTAVYNRANAETFYFLARAAMAPEPGPMAATSALDGTKMYDAVNTSSQFAQHPDFDLSPIDGRYVADEFNSNAGGDWDYQYWMNRAGFNIERGYAIRTLLDSRPTLFTISRASYLDGRAVMKNFQMDNGLGLDRFLGGILSEDWKNVAPRVDTSAAGVMGKASDGLPYRTTQMLNLLDTKVTPPANSTVVFPDIGYKTELQTLVWADLFAALNSDTTLIKKLAIYVKGIDYVDALSPADVISFTDPDTGTVYLARKFGPDTIGANTVDSGIASRMLQHAIDIQNNPYAAKSDLTNYVGLIATAHEIEKDLAKQSAWGAVGIAFQ